MFGELHVVFVGPCTIGMAFHQNIGFGVFLKNTGQFIQSGRGSSLNIGFIGVKIHTGIFIKGNVDTLAYSLHLGTGDFLFDTFRLSIHTVTDITARSTSNSGS